MLVDEYITNIKKDYLFDETEDVVKTYNPEDDKNVIIIRMWDKLDALLKNKYTAFIIADKDNNISFADIISADGKVLDLYDTNDVYNWKYWK